MIILEKVNVLVTSAGIASAVNVIKSLRLQSDIPVSIIAVDKDKLASGLHLADHAYVSPEIKDFKKYLDFLLAVCRKHNIRALYPCYSREISAIAGAKSLFQQLGVETLLPAPEVIDLCNNKRKLREFAIAINLRLPKCFEADKIEEIRKEEFPLFIKPVSGSSSIGAIKVENKRELTYHLCKKKDVLIQEFIEGEEVTVDVFCNRHSTPIVISPRIRIATKSGQSIKGITIDNSEFIEPIMLLCHNLPLIGACNIQFIKSSDGLVLIEVNPRYAAGGLMLTVYAGANIPQLALKEMLGFQITERECQVRPGISMSRYWEEIFTDEEKLRMCPSREVL